MEHLIELPTKRKAAKAILEVFNSEGLDAQQVDEGLIGSRSCYYRSPETGCPCAIGVLIPDGNELLSDNHNGRSLRDLIEDGLVKVREGDAYWFNQLQIAHDAWVTRRNPRTQEEYSREFKAILDEGLGKKGEAG